MELPKLDERLKYILNSMTIQTLDELFEGAYIVDDKRRIVYWNPSAEKISGFNAQKMVGSYCHDNILGHVDEQGCVLCTNACPIVEAMKKGKSGETILFLHHKNGFRLPVEVRVVPLYDDQGNSVGAIEFFREHLGNRDISEELQRLSKLSMLDPLTELGNRRFIAQRIDNAISQLTREEQTFGIIFIDIDRFKVVNDNFGHEIGDQILSMVAQTLKRNIRAHDSVGRWGGEEFICLMEHASSDKLQKVAEKLRSLVETSFILSKNEKISVTISAGLTMGIVSDTHQSVIARADTLMYQAKNKGRNKVVFG